METTRVPDSADRAPHDATERPADDAIRCDACPVLCYIKPGRTGSCDRYANHDGQLVRLDPHVLLDQAVSRGDSLVPFLERQREWDGTLVNQPTTFVTAIGAGTTYPDYKPAPFIISSEVAGIDMVTVVTEGIFSYCGVKVKIDTDRHLGPETATVRAEGEAVGHVTTSEYGSQMLSLGGVRHLTGGSRHEGTVTCQTLLDLCNGKPAELTIDGGASVIVQANKPPIVDKVREERMRVGCGSATIGMFAKQWFGKVDDVVVVDDHITGVLSQHQAGKLLGVAETGIRIKGRRSTPGRYFQVAEPGTAWGGTNIDDPRSILKTFDPKAAWPGLRLLMVSTTGEHSAYFELDDNLELTEKDLPQALKESVARIRENCEPALSTILFMGGAGGSLRAGVTENPVRLTLSVKDALTRVTCGGAPAYVWPGGGITFMVDVSRMPANAFGYVPTPAIVAPIEFTLKLADYAALGGHMDHVRPLSSITSAKEEREHRIAHPENPWPLEPSPRAKVGTAKIEPAKRDRTGRE
jgi:6-hydroxynicotinate reductase